MCTRKLIAAAVGLALALAAAPLSALHSQGTPAQDSASRRAWGVNPGPVTRKPQARPEVAADSSFIREALAGNLQEVRLGKLAEQKATNPAVKQFAQRMVTDHTTMGNQWTALAASNGLPLKPGADPAQEAEAARLEQLSGAEFDRAYMTSMIQDHRHDVEIFQSQGPSANSADARQLAASGLPTLQQHLSMAVQAGRQVGATSVASTPSVPRTTSPGANQNGQVASRPAPGGRNALTSDEAYVRNLAAGNLMEIRMGELALRKAADPDVKQFAERMVTNFTEWQKRWTGMASRSGMPFEPGMGPLHRQKVDRLRKLSGAAFDRAYMTTVIQHFQALLPYFQKEGRAARSPQVRNLVESELPVLRQYLTLARRTGRQVHADLSRSGQDRNVSDRK